MFICSIDGMIHMVVELLDWKATCHTVSVRSSVGMVYRCGYLRHTEKSDRRNGGHRFASLYRAMVPYEVTTIRRANQLGHEYLVRRI